MKTGQTHRLTALATALIIVLLPILQATPALPAKPSPKLLQPELLAENETSPVRVIALLAGWEGLVGLDPGRAGSAVPGLRTVVARLQERAVSALEPGAVRVTARYENLPALALEVSPGELENLLAQDGVALVEEDRRLIPRGGGGPPLPVLPAAAGPGMKGEGVSIAFIDTGVDYKTVGRSGFPNDKVIGGYDYGDDDPDPLDCNGHGTGMALIATTWIAPEAKAYAFKVCPGCCQKDGDWVSKMLAAWDWVVSHKNDDPAHPIKVMNVSYDNYTYSGSICDQRYPAVAAAAANLTANGIAIFVAAGNNGFCDGTTFPACLSQTIAVGAVYQKNIGPMEFCVNERSCAGQPGQKCKKVCRDDPTVKDRVSCCSNSAGFVDILAQSQGRTSGATAYASGVAAVIQGYAKRTRGRFLSVAELKKAMIEMAEPVRDRKSKRVTPRINIYQVYNRLKTLDWGRLAAR